MIRGIDRSPDLRPGASRCKVAAVRTLLLIVALSSVAMAAEEAFPPSPIGQPALRTLPAGVLLKASAPGRYFDQSGRLFGPLFRYISKHDIAMTTPVETQIEQAAMYFWVAPSQRAKVAGSRDGVEVIDVPERLVASLGARGGYSETNFAKVRDQLQAWLSTQPQVEATGPAYGVFWNAPFVPAFLKRFEVHIPVKTKPGTTP